MAFSVRRADYFYTTVEDRPGEGHKLLTQLADVDVNLLAFAAVPIGPVHTQLTLFPDDAERMASAARKAGLALDGPHPALLVQGDDDLGALAGVHEKLFEAGVNVYASTCTPRRAWRTATARTGTSCTYARTSTHKPPSL
jgi:hypothetical protein